MEDRSGAALVEPSADIGVVDDVLDSAAGHLDAQHGRLVSAAVWMLEHVDAWQGDGLWTPEAYLRWRTGLATATAPKVLDVAAAPMSSRSASTPSAAASCHSTSARRSPAERITCDAILAPVWCTNGLPISGGARTAHRAHGLDRTSIPYH